MKNEVFFDVNIMSWLLNSTDDCGALDRKGTISQCAVEAQIDESWNDTGPAGISGTNDPSATGAADITPAGGGGDKPVGPP